jgi:hypothetical protein
MGLVPNPEKAMSNILSFSSSAFVAQTAQTQAQAPKAAPVDSDGDHDGSKAPAAASGSGRRLDITA